MADFKPTCGCQTGGCRADGCQAGLVAARLVAARLVAANLVAASLVAASLVDARGLERPNLRGRTQTHFACAGGWADQLSLSCRILFAFMKVAMNSSMWIFPS